MLLMFVIPAKEMVIIKIYLRLCYNSDHLIRIFEPMELIVVAVVTGSSYLNNNITPLREHRLNNLIWNMPAKKEIKVTSLLLHRLQLRLISTVIFLNSSRLIITLIATFFQAAITRVLVFKIYILRRLVLASKTHKIHLWIHHKTQLASHGLLVTITPVAMPLKEMLKAATTPRIVANP